MRTRSLVRMKALTVSIAAVVVIAVMLAHLDLADTAGAVLVLGSPFALFANVMAREKSSAGFEDGLRP